MDGFDEVIEIIDRNAKRAREPSEKGAEYRLVLIEKEKKRNDKKVPSSIERIDSTTNAQNAEEMCVVTSSSNFNKDSYSTPQNLKRRLNYESKTEEQKAAESAARMLKTQSKTEEQKAEESAARMLKAQSKTEEQKAEESAARMC